MSLAVLAAFAGCTAKSEPSAAEPAAAKAPAPAPAAAQAPVAAQAPATAPAGDGPVAAMDAAIKTLMQKAEVADESITVQHILLSFQGAPRMTGVTRSKDEAQQLAAKVYAEAIAGGDFDALVKQHTNDSAPGIYPMTKAGRSGMVKGFGDVGFRLKVGEIGVSPWHMAASPFGWHVIKRVK